MEKKINVLYMDDIMDDIMDADEAETSASVGVRSPGDGAGVTEGKGVVEGGGVIVCSGIVEEHNIIVNTGITERMDPIGGEPSDSLFIRYAITFRSEG